ncbi:hypothetical protein V6N11_042492 [Hibiscus sabdariffa]|uniref:Uncharacterized protein n=1 Tax=Hibiscus sabdariffa TaxID=183260 RepID=A0ABR2QWL2_9ROSI
MSEADGGWFVVECGKELGVQFGAVVRDLSILYRDGSVGSCLGLNGNDDRKSEGLSAFGAEFNYFLPCRSSCMANQRDNEEKGIRSGRILVELFVLGD